MSTPTLRELKDQYLEAATIERLKRNKPSEQTVRNTLSGLRVFCSWLKTNEPELGEPADLAVDALVTPKLLRRYVTSLLARGIRPISALSFVSQFRQLFARWARPYYEDLGWQLPAFPDMGGGAQLQRYRRPPSELIERVKDWYHSLKPDMTWYAATMMLEFAVRNGDVKRLERGNFVDVKGRVFLNYTPNKTSHSSGRVVKWPVHPDIWARLERLRPWDRRMTDAPLNRVNKAMRELGFHGTKGAYELRKLCIDHVYQRFGAEMAVSISGDDIRTITRYYADPSQPNIGDLRVSELL